MGDEEAVDFTRTFASDTPAKSSRPSSMSHTLGSGSSEDLEGRFPPGTLLNGRYRIIALLGRGGMGEVYRATDLTLGQSVALKFLPLAATSDSRWLERFHNEVRIARQVSHPNVCRVYDIGEAEGVPFISMEYVDGEDLATLLKRIGRLPNDKALEISRKVCAGLSAAHARGVIHRDLKPANIMLDKRGEVLICDFGLAAVASELGEGEAKQGTPAYMAPEQLKGTSVNERSDIYALGLVLYELFTGKKAYLATNINALLNQQEAMELTSMSSIAQDIDPAVEKAIRRCLDPDPMRRPATALQVSAALPGGDPLAAALAAGETPSPEMVAAGQSKGLAKKYSIPLVAFIVLGMCVLFLSIPMNLPEYAPLPFPPEALVVKAREMAAKLGYPDKGLDSKFWMAETTGMRQHLEKRAGKKEWSAWFHKLSPVELGYRQSPKYLAIGPDGQVRWKVPVLEEPGMYRIRIDAEGRLREFEGVPKRGVSPQPEPVTAEQLVQWIGLDPRTMEEIPPARVPQTASDERHRWRVKMPEGFDGVAQVDATYWEGRLTQVKIAWPWTQPEGVEKTKTMIEKVQDAVGLGLGGCFLFYAIVLSRKNWKAGRADRKGALRVALFMIAIEMVVWFLNQHYIPETEMIGFFFRGLADSLLTGLIFWTLYLALEPALRARWPHSIITWNRVLNGKWQDPQVAAHLLVGASMAALIILTFTVRGLFEFQSTQRISGILLTFVSGPRSWMSIHFSTAQGAMQSGLSIFFLLFGLRVLLRKEWIAVVVASLVLALGLGGNGATLNPLLDYSLFFLVYLVILLVITRFGLLSTVFGLFFTNMMGRMAFASDSNSWINPYSITTFLMLLAVIGVCFRLSLGEQDLIGDTE